MPPLHGTGKIRRYPAFRLISISLTHFFSEKAQEASDSADTINVNRIVQTAVTNIQTPFFLCKPDRRRFNAVA